MSRLLYDEFQALAAKLARHPDEDVRRIVEEAVEARMSEGELLKKFALNGEAGLTGPECIHIWHQWGLEQFGDVEPRGPGGDA